MYEDDKKKLIKDLYEHYKRAASSTKKEAINFLVKTGMYTKKGKLKSQFK